MKDEYGKVRKDADGHEFIIPLSKVDDYDDFYRHLESIGCQGESEDSYYHALDQFEKEFGQYQIDGDERDFTVILPERIKATL